MKGRKYSTINLARLILVPLNKLDPKITGKARIVFIGIGCNRILQEKYFGFIGLFVFFNQYFILIFSFFVDYIIKCWLFFLFKTLLYIITFLALCLHFACCRMLINDVSKLQNQSSVVFFYLF